MLYLCLLKDNKSDKLSLGNCSIDIYMPSCLSKNYDGSFQCRTISQFLALAHVSTRAGFTKLIHSSCTMSLLKVRFFKTWTEQTSDVHVITLISIMGFTFYSNLKFRHMSCVVS